MGGFTTKGLQTVVCTAREKRTGPGSADQVANIRSVVGPAVPPEGGPSPSPDRGLMFGGETERNWKQPL